jgi:hypothetical protein
VRLSAGLLRVALDPSVTPRTPATKPKMAQRTVRLAQEGIRDAQQLVEAAIDEGMVPAI